MRGFLKANARFYLFLFGITIYFGIAFGWADFLNTPFKNASDLIILILQWLTVLFATFGLLYLIVINKYVFALFFPILILVSSTLAYYRVTLNISLTANLLDIIFDNDIRTSLDLISIQLIAFVVVNLLISILLVRYRIKKLTNAAIYIHIPLALLILLVTVGIKTRIKAPTIHRIPYVILFSWKDYLFNKKVIETKRPDITQDATSKEDSLIVVYIQGESLRADHLSLNGYMRQTTPYLEEDQVISFSNIYSPFTDTDESLPYILTDADTTDQFKGYRSQSFISLFKKCRFKTYWVANQEPTQSYIYFANESDSLIYTNAGKTVYDFEPYSWLDEEMNIPLMKAIADTSQLKLILLHSIGSHWWYKSHYTPIFEKFEPVISSRIVSSNTQAELINTYDNTILYTDYFLHQIIQSLKDKPAILIYLSDHGEALGENDQWLHANDAEPIHHPACIVWLSGNYQKQFPEAKAALIANKDQYFNSSFLFHSILDAAEIHTPLLQPKYSIFRKHQ